MANKKQNKSGMIGEQGEQRKDSEHSNLVGYITHLVFIVLIMSHIIKANVAKSHFKSHKKHSL